MLGCRIILEILRFVEIHERLDEVVFSVAAAADYFVIPVLAENQLLPVISLGGEENLLKCN